MTERYPINSEMLYDNNNGVKPNFSAVYEDNRGKIYNYFLKRTFQPELAADLTQDVFLSAFTAWDNFIDKGGRIPAWLSKIARGKLIDHFRRSGPSARNLFIENDSSAFGIKTKDPGPEEIVIKRETLGMLQNALECLTVDQRNAINLRFIKDLSSLEAARILGKHPVSFRGTQLRAIDALRRNLGIEVQ